MIEIPYNPEEMAELKELIKWLSEPRGPCSHEHMFCYSSSSTNQACPDDQWCLCGKYQYKELK